MIKLSNTKIYIHVEKDILACLCQYGIYFYILVSSSLSYFKSLIFNLSSLYFTYIHLYWLGMKYTMHMLYRELHPWP